VTRVNPNPARFDLAKCEAIDGTWIRLLDGDDLAERLVRFMEDDGSLSATDAAAADVVRAAAPLVQERVATLGEASAMLRFLVVSESEFDVDPAAVSGLKQNAADVLAGTREVLHEVETWDAATIEAALRARLVDDMGVKPRLAFGPARVGVTGRRVSPPLFESMELLGRDRTLARLESLASLVSP
jgi:glutamyl-tRNA synthetase